jgi:branched-chain amino acid transport system ATP-binding protein
MLKLENLSAGYGALVIINGINLSVKSGEKVAILGRNGVGKSTLMAALMGILEIKNGSLKFGDEDITHATISQRARMGLGYVPQTRDVFSSLTVKDNLRVALKAGSKKSINDGYELFPSLKALLNTFAGKLSGGEQQMLSIARAMVGEPSILLLDEPLEGLAALVCYELMDSLNTLSSNNTMAIVLVEQKIERALDFADRVMILERGSIVWAGSCVELKSQPKVIERYIGVF